MHVYYKFGLLLIFLLSVSISHTNAAPAGSEEAKLLPNTDDDYDYNDDDYSDETTDKEVPETAENRLMPELSSSSTTTTFRPIFNIPRRSNHVLEPSCPRNCLCLEDFKYVQCTNAHLTHVPLDLPKTAAIIDLSHNVIAELRPEDFANLSRAVEITLNHNLISNIDKEVFQGSERLQRLRLANNRLTKIDPDTFSAAKELIQLDLSNNTITQRLDGSFLNQPNLVEFSCSNCSWTELPEQTFENMSALQVLRLNNNDFKQQINTRAFTPLKNLIKLKLPELDQPNIEELCNLLKSIDNISFRHFDVSCYELVLGTSFNESLITATDPPFIRITNLPTLATSTAKPATGTPAPPRTATRNRGKMANSTDVVKAGILSSVTESNSGDSVETSTEKEKPYQVPISQEAINTLLICIMALAVIGIVIGLICRKDIGGIKTKCCRTSKPKEPKDQVHPTEEIPLNKLA
ncbi:leucine-rich repeat and transmembrane domain-containing protein 2 [Drosophila kikkawai]|uniref:Leucine-rich repeat and transmembrane domain-containing protein 2 n=1 Tax=Drosophila kikkawai TaxID=30033 RepID=A0A6P4HLF0_DROKI|nr:leucine-rich repeat and transmembrane domain-containing protein 2 [Drosophila kikkawai]XP_017016385.1 leucine-rich repeat and transmembrane domain-containing protein 2 [Drosophila kikkawai]XP_017016386.1 leucine-rich repeat and transmembrane domain-containing protein 2 [Drosophila kikkawai]XP_017016387.1 leucine-rich repeat and transmembrane domain-containing protein 2 [Drosophila kikkawai]